jgi:hypothetical protein
MMSRVARSIALLVSFAAIDVIAANAIEPSITAKKTALVTIPATFRVAAPVSRVWATASSVAGFGAITGFVPAEGAKTTRFAEIGDALPATMWTDKGMLVATRVTNEKELRVAWEPESGGYLCGKRIVLTPVQGGTQVEYWDRYTDDQPNVDETAAQVVKETQAGIAKFTEMAQKK